MPLPAFAASSSDRALAGVCGGIASALGVDVTLVRLVFALLALAGGAGVVLYLALWLYADGRPVWLAGLGVVLSGSLLLHAVGLSGRAVAGIALVAAGLAVAWRHGGGLRPDAPLSYAGYALVGVGAVILLAGGGDAPSPLLAPGAVAGGLLLIAGPWLWRLALERDAERSARIRGEERADVAARIHDSVLQTPARKSPWSSTRTTRRLMPRSGECGARPRCPRPASTRRRRSSLHARAARGSTP